jgi:hypothetical protein
MTRKPPSSNQPEQSSSSEVPLLEVPVHTSAWPTAAFFSLTLIGSEDAAVDQVGPGLGDLEAGGQRA